LHKSVGGSPIEIAVVLPSSLQQPYLTELEMEMRTTARESLLVKKRDEPRKAEEHYSSIRLTLHTRSTS
jgi:hypothetical protein